MPKKIKITCDNCGKDLTTIESAWSNELRLFLTSETIPNTSIVRYPEPKYYRVAVNNAYFCDLDCLKAWIAKKEDLLNE